MVKDKVVLITGGNTGIGAATARLLAMNGAKVIVNYRADESTAARLVSEIQRETGSPDSALAVPADVAEEEQVKKMVEIVMEKYGRIDVIVNNACPKPQPAGVPELNWEDYQKFIDVVVKGAYHLAKQALPQMVERKEGKLINVLTSYVFSVPPPKLSPYLVAKHALEGFSKALAAELGPLGISVNMVSPGVTRTRFTEHLPEKMFEVLGMQTPLRRLAEAEDTARTILFLASEKSKGITGVNIPVCGGSVM